MKNVEHEVSSLHLLVEVALSLSADGDEAVEPKQADSYFKHYLFNVFGVGFETEKYEDHPLELAPDKTVRRSEAGI